MSVDDEAVAVAADVVGREPVYFGGHRRQLFPHVGARPLDGEAGERRRPARPGRPLERRVEGVGLPDRDVIVLDPELSRHDLGQRRGTALADLGAARAQRGRPVRVEADDGGRHRRGAGIGGAHRQCAGAETPGLARRLVLRQCLGDDVDVGDEIGIERALAGHHHVPRAEEVAAPQLHGVETEALRGLVDVELAGEGPLWGSEPPVRRRGGGGGVDRPATNTQVGDAVRAETAMDRFGQHERAVVGVGAAVEGNIEVAAGDVAVAVEPRPHPYCRRVGPRREHRSLDVDGDLDRAAGEPRGGGGEWLQLGVRLRAVPSADVRHLDPHGGEWQSEHAGELGSDLQGVLRGRDDVEVSGPERGRGVVQLHRIAEHHRVGRGRLDDVLGAGHRQVDITPLDAVFVNDVAGRLRAHTEEAVVGFVAVEHLVDQDVGVGGLRCAHQRCEIVVLDVHQRCGVERRVARFGDHQRHGLAVVADLVDGQHGMIGDDVAEPRLDALEVGAAHHGDDTLDPAGQLDIDANDAGVGSFGAHDRAERRMRQLDVARVRRCSGHLVPSVDAAGRTTGTHAFSRSRGPTTDRTASSIGR